MTEPTEVLIQTALLTQLTTPALSGSPTIAYPLVAFTPPAVAAGAKYLDARAVLRAAPEPIGLSFTDSYLKRGIFQVDAVAVDGEGEAPGLRLASLVVARFAAGTVLVAGSRYVQIVKEATIAPLVKDAPWVRFPVSIPYLLIT